MITDPTIIRIGQAVQLGHQGERDAAGLLFAEIWDEIGGEQGDPIGSWAISTVHVSTFSTRMPRSACWAMTVMDS